MAKRTFASMYFLLSEQGNESSTERMDPSELVVTGHVRIHLSDSKR
jgi:hypothetical protein